MKKWKTISVWLLQVLLCFAFLIASLGKLTSAPAVLAMFQAWGYPVWLAGVIGVVELTGAVLLLVPRAAFWGCCLLMVVMVGAAFTHLVSDPPLQVLRPLIFFLLLWIIAQFRWKQLTLRKRCNQRLAS